MAHPTDPSGVLSGRAVILRIDGLRLLLRQGDVAELESVVDLDRFRPPPHGIGWLNGRGQPMPVYCVSAALKPIMSVPPSRRICAVLSDQAATGNRLAVLCDDAELVDVDTARLHAVPTALAVPGNAAVAIALLSRGLVWVTTAAAFAACVCEPRSESVVAPATIDAPGDLPSSMDPSMARVDLEPLPVPAGRIDAVPSAGADEERMALDVPDGAPA